MKKSLLAGVLLLAGLQVLPAQNSRNGFYKDLFIDSGVGVDCFYDLPAAKLLGLTVENFTSRDEDGEVDSATVYEKSMMKNIFVGSQLDENGPLLYPDGAPRFRVIYIIGGSATTHGKQLGAEGRGTIRTFYANGGSYIGTCAGAFICSKGTYSYSTGKENDKEAYLGIWPGYTVSTGLDRSYTALAVEKKSPLLKYSDFGGDRRIDSVRHNGGCCIRPDAVPAGTEILARFIADTIDLKHSIHNMGNAWAYKANEKSGRLVVTGSHPERMMGGERLEMFASMLRYAMDGNGAPQVKANLVSGEERVMSCKTSDKKPEFARLGDRQYHHFTIDVPKGAKQVVVELTPGKGASIFDLSLFAASGAPALSDNAQWQNIDYGAQKNLVIDNPKAGKLYISVFCETTVETKATQCGPQYVGHTEVLNGVPYVIKATVINK